MHSIRLVIEYDGTGYCGWQLQPNGLTVQQVMEEALAQLLGEHVRLTSSGRTDAGVHARGMVACFRTSRTLPPKAYTEGLAAFLPRDIAVRSAEEVPESFHPRFDAVGKHYRYTILSSRSRSPLNRLYTWQVKEPLDLELMGRGGEHFIGEHDFAAFRGYNCSAKTTVRTIHSLEVTRQGEFVVIDVKGSGFLKNMVRIMVGTLAEVGRGKLLPEDIPALLSGGSRPDAGATAPPQGLCLVEVYY